MKWQDGNPNIIYKTNFFNWNTIYEKVGILFIFVFINTNEGHEVFLLISMNVDTWGHKFDWENNEVFHRRNIKNIIEFIEAWDLVQSPINVHIEIDPIY